MRRRSLPVLWIAASCTATGHPAADTDTDAVDTDLASDTDAVDTDRAADTDLPADTDPATDSDTDTDASTDTDLPDLTEPNPCGARVPSVVLGTGEYAYAAVTDGQDLEMVHGPQPGTNSYHFWFALSVANSPQYVTITYDITRLSDGSSLGHSSLNLQQVPVTMSGACMIDGSDYGARAQLDLSAFTTVPPWQPICGESLRIDAHVTWAQCTDFVGTTCVSGRYQDVAIGGDSMTFVAQPDPADAAHCAPVNP